MHKISNLGSTTAELGKAIIKLWKIMKLRKLKSRGWQVMWEIGHTDPHISSVYLSLHNGNVEMFIGENGREL